MISQLQIHFKGVFMELNHIEISITLDMVTVCWILPIIITDHG